MVFCNSKDDGFPRAGVLFRCKFFIVLPCVSVELLYHFSVRVFISPFAFELNRVIALVFYLGTFSHENGYACSKFIRNEISLSKSILNRVRKIRLAIPALIELEGVPLDERRGRRSEADVECIKVSKGSLPSSIYRPVTLVCNNDVEVSTREFCIASDHGLKQADRYLLLLPGHSRAKPVTAILVEYVLYCLDCLFCKLLSICKEKYAFCPS